MEWMKSISEAVEYIENHITENITADNVAIKYGYDSPDSFTKAFTRFHGITPSMVRKDGTIIKSFAPLKYENAKQEIPLFWQEHYASGKGKYVCGMFGINIDEQMGCENFEYLIADIYNPVMDIPEGFVTKQIPKGNTG